MTSIRRSDDERSRRPHPDEDEDDRTERRAPVRKKKRPGASRQSSPQPNWLELLPLGIAVGVGIFFLFPILLSPKLFLLTFFVGIGISIFAFVKCCMLAAREGNFVSFDYLADLGPLRWVLAVGFFGFYVMGFFVLWAIAQIGTAFAKPKVFLPWFGLQAYGVVVIVLGLIVGAISERLWQGARPAPPSPPARGPSARTRRRSSRRRPRRRKSPSRPR